VAVARIAEVEGDRRDVVAPRQAAQAFVEAHLVSIALERRAGGRAEGSAKVKGRHPHLARDVAEPERLTEPQGQDASHRLRGFQLPPSGERPASGGAGRVGARQDLRQQAEDGLLDRQGIDPCSGPQGFEEGPLGDVGPRMARAVGKPEHACGPVADSGLVVRHRVQEEGVIDREPLALVAERTHGAS
jgi:hypothetical protein